MPSFFFTPAAQPPVPTQNQAASDDFLFHQGSAEGLGQIKFHDYRQAFAGVGLPNVQRFAAQAEIFRELLASDPLGPDQMKDVAFLLAGGEIFALVVYAQLILENPRCTASTPTCSTRSSTSWCATWRSSPCSASASRRAPRRRWRAASA